jgi:hypothetical protein
MCTGYLSVNHTMSLLSEPLWFCCVNHYDANSNGISATMAKQFVAGSLNDLLVAGDQFW